MDHRLSAIVVVFASAACGLAASPSPAHPAAPACLRLCEQEVADVAQRECLKWEQVKAQAELDAILAEVRQSLSRRDSAENRDSLQALEAAQTAWTAYQGAECQAVAANWAGGSGQRVALVYCLVEHLRQRSFEVWRSYHVESLPEPRVLCRDLNPDS